MIVITGAAGFIGSCMAAKMNEMGRDDLILVDDFTKEAKRPNWQGKKYVDKIQRDAFFEWAEHNAKHIDCIIHLGARTDTTEFDYSVFEELNVYYTKRVWHFASQHGIPLLYASSAATYGAGEFGYEDDERLIDRLQPLNPYGRSKNEIDKWILKQTITPPFWCGFKFFNVYGPNEYHKGRMASVIFHSFNQIKETGKVRLFKSHRPDYEDGQQLRDFVYVKDVVRVLYWFTQHHPRNGIYNLGTGCARPFLTLAESTFKAMGLEPNIEFIDMPDDIRDKYQYFTEASIKKMRSMGYRRSFYALEDGVKSYVSKYLLKDNYF
ncbi:MAG: ADP-glyceromanno-heptose 6-epimerase [Bacteroidales bacterium]|nr:ADP-glyceromanno-heptose 6-epimerase [Bacteroidales bacterium]